MTTRTIKAAGLPASLQRPVTLTNSGHLRYWATVYEILGLAHLKDSTVARHLNAIDAFYRHVEERHGHDTLDPLLGALDVDRIVSVLESHFIALRNVSVQTGANNREAWKSVMHFVETTLNRISNTDSPSLEVRRKIARLGGRLENLQPNIKRAASNVVRALPSAALVEVYEIFNPASVRNPFRGERQRWRNHCLLLAMLHQGLRRGEALLLPVDAIKEGIDDQSLRSRFWMNVQNLYGETDPRRSNAPSIKNVYSIRQIPVSADVASRFRYFAAEQRGRSPHPQLFLNSSGSPLGTRSVANIMKTASEALSKVAKQSLVDSMRDPILAAHDLRHTCAVVRLYHYRSAGIAEEDALQKLRAFFGWSYDSSMPRRYARAYWERHIAEVWNDDFDAHIDAIRSIEHTVR